MSEQKYYTLIKVTPNDVLFDLHPVSNISLTRRIYLDKNKTRQPLPLDWALGVFQDDSVYHLYKSGAFTFDDNDGIAKDAFEAGVYFDEKLDFVPAKVDDSKEILAVLKSGNRANINKMVEQKGKQKIIDVAALHVDELTQGVINLLESLLNVQLVLDEQ